MPLAAIAAIVGIGSSIFGAVNQSSAESNASNAANTAAQGQNAIDQQLAGIYNQLFQQYQTSYQPLVGGVTSNLGSLSSGASGAGGDLSTYLAMLSNPALVQAMTGIPTTQAAQGAYNYFGSPGSTNLATAAPGIENLLTQTMQTGISPDLISQAVNQNDTATQQQISSIRNQLGAGLPNLSGTIENLQGQEGTSNASLLAGLEGQSQNLKLQAGQGLETLTSGLDTQTANMLLEALGIGNQQSATTLGNEGTAVSTGSNIDALVQQIINSGMGMATQGASGLQQLGQQYATAGGQAASNLNSDLLTNPFAGLSANLFGQAYNPSGAGTQTVNYTDPIAATQPYSDISSVGAVTSIPSLSFG